uniref:Uncharacterized protein n=1 Tax=Arundo donax TaxID=35708 RepID=A0A0A9DVN9_ARUDO
MLPICIMMHLASWILSLICMLICLIGTTIHQIHRLWSKSSKDNSLQEEEPELPSKYTGDEKMLDGFLLLITKWAKLRMQESSAC